MDASGAALHALEPDTWEGEGSGELLQRACMESPTRASAGTDVQVWTPPLARLGMVCKPSCCGEPHHGKSTCHKQDHAVVSWSVLSSAHLTTLTSKVWRHRADWEDLNLERLVLEPSPAAAAAALRAYERPKGTRLASPGSVGTAADRRQNEGTASSTTPVTGGSRSAPYPVPAGELPFDGAHILEAYDLSPATTTGRLEVWLESLQLQPLGPVVRRARLLQWSSPVVALIVCGVATHTCREHAKRLIYVRADPRSYIRADP